MLTNSAKFASLLEDSNCRSTVDVVREMEKEVKGDEWEKEKRGFEQHMLEEDRVRADWKRGAFEKNEECKNCGSKNAWNQRYQRCQIQCQESLNALQAFPYAAWDDISAAPLDPVKVTAARNLEIDYAENKPVWRNMPRWQAKERGWGIIKPRWIDINKGDDDKPNYRSRMVGKEFNDREVDGLFAATPPLESFRLLLSWAATADGGPLSSVGETGSAKSILIADVSRAFFEAPAKRGLL